MINRRELLSWAMGTTLTLAAQRATAAEPQKPNIIFILADDAGVGDFACYGSKHIRTPNIDRLAAEGMRFTRAYSGSAVCAPTRCALMTGLHTGHCRRRANPSKNGLIPLASDDYTVAELLKQAGYACGGFGKWGLGNPGTTGVPEKHGFDVFFGYYDQTHAHDYYTDHLVRNSQDVALPGNAAGKRQQYSHDLIVEESLKFVEQNKNRPFFLYAAWTLPHGKFEIPSDEPYSQENWPQQIKNYAAMISRLDADIGRLMNKLKELGLDERTIVIFSSDNGPNPPFAQNLNSAAGLRGVKRFLYEGGIRAPLIARWPGRIQPASQCDLITDHVDFFPTAADLAGIATAGPKLDGVSIAPALFGRPQPATRQHLYWEIHEPFFQQAVRLGDWKGYRTGTKSPLELYDLKADPTEKTNVAAAHPEIVKKIESIMAAEHVESPHWPAPEMPKPRPARAGTRARNQRQEAGQ